ncbi:DNA glycosylase [Schizophyllum commune]
MGKRAPNSDCSEYEGGNSSGSDYVSKPVLNKRKAKAAPKTRTKKVKVDSEDKSETRTLSVQHSVSMHKIDDPAPMRAALLAWYDGVSTSRGMPWRKPFRPESTRDERAQRAYEVWVSEIMLQQTQVSTVIAYYNRWMEKFPTLADLAKANIDDVNALWKGLGYYSRAKRLLEGAQKAVKDYGGQLPDNAKDMQANIPGIGRYSAGAICSIAYGERVPVLDGNVHRLMSRVLALHANPKAKATLDLLWTAAEAMVMAPEPGIDAKGPTQHAGDINQALIELGSTVCKVKDPNCASCPISSWCKAYTGASHQEEDIGDIEDLCQLCEPLPDDTSVTIYPMRVERKKAREEVDAVNVIEWRGHDPDQNFIMLVRRPANGLLAGLYEFPTIEDVSEDACAKGHTAKLLSTYLKDGVLPMESGEGSDDQLRVVSLRPKGDVLHIFSHVRKTYRVTHVVIQGGDSPPVLAARASQDRPSAAPKPVKKGKAKGKAKGATASSASAPADGPSAVWTEIAKVSDAK